MQSPHRPGRRAGRIGDFLPGVVEPGVPDLPSPSHALLGLNPTPVFPFSMKRSSPQTEEKKTRHLERRPNTRSGKRSDEKSLFSRWTLVKKVIDWVRREYIPSSGSADRFSTFLRRIEVQLRCQGLSGAIAYCKRRRQEVLGYLSAEPGSPQERKYRLKLIHAWGRSGAELVLQRDPSKIRMVLTVCSSLRSFRLPVRVDLSPITNPGPNREEWVDPGAVKLFWEQLRRRFRVPKLESAQFREWHFSLKSGPGKGQALFSWANDLVSLPEILVDDLKVIGGKVFEEHLEVLRRNLPAIQRVYSPKKGAIRRLAGIADLEGKTRVVAMLDYFSQAVLYPVHQFLFAILRQIPQDVTFHQGSFVEKVRSWGPGVRLQSLDLTAATDRFPIRVICELLRGFFPEPWVQSWTRIMVEHPFECSGHADSVKYAIGNPMGAYSSWASFALAHHFVVFQACLRVGIPWRDCRYVLLGDDILIGEPAVGDEYRKIMSSLGVEINDLKTHDSPHFGEFAKRYFYRGEEVTPFPVSAVLDNLGEIPLLVSALDGETKKGYYPISGIPGSLQELARSMHYRRSACKKWKEWALTAQMGLEYGRGNVEAWEFILSLNHAPSEAYAEYVFRTGTLALQHALQDLLERSLSGEKVGAKLGLMDQVSDLLYGGGEDGTGAEPVLPAHLPLLGVLLRFERSLMDLDFSGDLGDVLEEFLANPLQASSWGMDARSRRARGFGRLARYLSLAVEKGQESYWGDGTSPSDFYPGSPWQTLGIPAHHCYGMAQMAAGRLRGTSRASWMRTLGTPQYR